MEKLRLGLGLCALLAACELGQDPVYRAARDGDAAALARLLASGADPNRVVRITQSGHSGATFRLTPLAAAAMRGDVPMIEQLVAAGADPHWDDGSFTAFEWAVRFEHPDAARRLWELSDGTSFAARGHVHIPLALRMQDTATLAFVLDRLGAGSCRAAVALTPLARSGAARTEGEIGHVRSLLERGVRPTPEALQWAARQARPQMVGLLIDRAERDGWLLDCVAAVPEGHDPLAGALRASLLALEIDMVRLLLERGADPNTRLPSGVTPLMLLVQRVYLAEPYGRPPHADPPLPSPSPYHEKWFAPLLSLLLEHGADLALRDLEGRTAADHVQDDDHDRGIKRRLLRPAADPDATEAAGAPAAPPLPLPEPEQAAQVATQNVLPV